MHRYPTLSARQIHALAPVSPPCYAPDPLWFWAPKRVRAVAYRLGGTWAQFQAANTAYRAGLRTAGVCFPGIRASLAEFRGHKEFRWDPMGSLTWPDIYVAVEQFYWEHPDQELWRGQALMSGQDSHGRAPSSERIVIHDTSEFMPHDAADPKG